MENGVLNYAVRLPCRGCNFPGIFCIWVINVANDFCFGRSIPKTHLFDEWVNPRRKGFSLLPQRSSYRGAIRHLRQETLPFSDSHFYVFSNSFYKIEPLVVFHND